GAGLAWAPRRGARAGRLGASASPSGPAAAVALSRLPAEIAAADLVVSCTGAPGHVITADTVAAALASREPATRALVLLDLALPRDVDPAAGQLPGATVIGLEAVGEAGSHGLAGAGGADGWTPGAHQEDV